MNEITITIPTWIVYLVLIYFGIDAALNAVDIWLKIKVRKMNKQLDEIKKELRKKSS